jgi:NADH-quinone oxidoreductase subunit M
VSVLLIVLPLATALMLFLPFETVAKRAIAVIGSAATLAAAVLVPASRLEVAWLPGIEAYFSIDSGGAAGPLITVAALMFIPTVVVAGQKIEHAKGIFLALLLLMQASLNGLFLAKDLLLYYVFWEATLIPSLIMLGTWGGEKRREATLKYLVYAVTSSFLMLIAILALRPLAGAASYRLADLLAVTPDLAVSTQLWLFAGFAIAFAVKVPLMPFHMWLPDFHEQNHPSGAADVAGTLYKVGAWGFFAWALPLLPAAANLFAPALITLAAITAVYAAVIATAQDNLKRFLAYASLSHMGIVGVGVFALNNVGLSGAMYLIAAQMVSTGGLFLIAGMLHERKQTFDMNAYGGLAKSAPALSALTMFVLFASIGVPGLSNFPGEFMSLMGAYQAFPLAGVLATLAVIAAGVYGVNMFQRVYQGEQQEATSDASWFEVLVLVPVVAGILWLGIAPSPQLARIDAQATLSAQLPSVPSRSSGEPAEGSEPAESEESTPEEPEEDEEIHDRMPDTLAVTPETFLGGQHD